MIEITIFKKNNYINFISKGHANYSKKGSDIVCSAVSATIFNMLKALEKYAEAVIVGNVEQGLIDINIKSSKKEKEFNILINVLFDSLLEIEKNYKKFLKINIKVGE